MELDTIVTATMLKEKGFWADVITMVGENYPEGLGYQALLDLLGKDSILKAETLLSVFGPSSNGTLILNQQPSKGKASKSCSLHEDVVYAGEVHILHGYSAGNIIAGRSIRGTGSLTIDHNITSILGGIRVLGSITAGENVTCSEGAIQAEEVRAGGNISAGATIRTTYDLMGQAIHARAEIDVGGAIEAKYGITSEGNIEVGGYIRGGYICSEAGGITAAGSISTAEGIMARGEVKAGDEYEIHASLGHKGCTVVAAKKPRNLKSGVYKKYKGQGFHLLP
jgi:hypothetical protein